MYFLKCRLKNYIFSANQSHISASCDTKKKMPHDCILNILFRLRSKKTSKLHVTGLCVGNSRVTGEFPAQKASDAEKFSNWWRHHDSTPGSAASHYAEVLPCRWDNIQSLKMSIASSYCLEPFCYVTKTLMDDGCNVKCMSFHHLNYNESVMHPVVYLDANFKQWTTILQQRPMTLPVNHGTWSRD